MVSVLLSDMVIFKQRALFFAFYTGYVSYVALTMSIHTWSVFSLNQERKIYGTVPYSVFNYIFEHSVCHIGGAQLNVF